MARQDTAKAAGKATDGNVAPFPGEPKSAPSQDAPEAPKAAEPAPAKKKRGLKPVIFGLVFLAVAAAGAYYGHGYWTVGRFMEKTDDAYLQADITVLSPRIQGYVSEIKFAENDLVKAGEPLVRLDDGDYRIALDLAQNRLTTLAATLDRIDAQQSAATAAVTEAQAQRGAKDIDIRNAQTRLDRISGLARSAVASQAALDDATDALATARAGATGADAAVATAQAQVGVIAAQRAETANQRRDLELAVAQAQRNLDLTVLRAPVDGTFTNLAVKLGDLVSPGAQMAAVVPTGHFYIEAFYKETQLGEIHPGAVAHVTIDALDGRTFEGHVTSLSPATGSMFSLLPPDNATGNFTKIVQRVGVRIALDDPAAQGRLRAGLSTVVEIDSRTGEGATVTAER